MKRYKKEKHRQKFPVSELYAVSSKGLPDNVPEMVNEYGTYEIQATADTENQYPAIAQGFNPKAVSTDCIKRPWNGAKR